MEEWRKYKLADITIMKNGKKRPHGEGVYPVYGGNGIMDYSNDYNAQETIVVGRVGAYCGCVYKCDGKCWVSDNAISVTARNMIDFHFLFYLMRTLDFHHHHIGGAQPLMTQDIIGDFVVSIPSLSVQKQIVSIFNSLDEKIEVNKQINDNLPYLMQLIAFIILLLLKRINDNLNQQAKTLFKSWFVDFEPFRDDKFVESEMGWIPSGWQVKELGEVTEPQNTRVKDRTDVKVLSPVTTGELVLSEEYFSKQVFSESIAKYIIVKPFDFAYNPARVNIGSLGMNTFDFDGCVSPVYVVFRCEDNYQYFFDLFRQTDYFKEEVKTRAIGGVRQTLGYKDFSLIKVVYPPKVVVEEFNKIYSTLLSKKAKNNVEITRLGELRDVLLPKLMSGELKVSEMNA